jgi:hypothetical protein
MVLVVVVEEFNSYFLSLVGSVISCIRVGFDSSGSISGKGGSSANVFWKVVSLPSIDFLWAFV